MPTTSPEQGPTPTNRKSGGKRISAEDIWPRKSAWNNYLHARSAKLFRSLGIGPGKHLATGLWKSQALDVLGAGTFAEFAVVRYPGAVIWFNFDLARQVGFTVPHTDQLTGALDRRILKSLSFKVLEPGDQVPDREVFKMYADRYGGDGVSPALGAGRAGFLPYGNLYLKGVGFTPLFRHNDPSDFVHSHGAAHLEDCLSEAILGEVNHNLFTHGSSRVLAVIDQGRQLTDPSGQPRHLGLAVRAGAQLRPAHLLGKRGRKSPTPLDQFVSVTSATGQLVTSRNGSTGAETPNIAATMLRVIDDHARTSAEAFRWRLIHGALSASNMEMSGAMLDLPTQSTQCRTAPVWKLDYAQSVYGSEHMERAHELASTYRRLLRSTAPVLRQRFNARWINIPREMEIAYRKHLQVQLVRATGLKIEVARRIQLAYSELAQRFTDIVLRLVALRNPGSACVAKSLVKDVSVVDVFGLFRLFPVSYFKNPNANHVAVIRRYLKPIFKGNRFHIARKRDRLRSLIVELAGVYRDLMEAAQTYAQKYYGDLKSMRASIIARAAFENEPIDALYCQNLYPAIRTMIRAYKSSGNAQMLRDAVDARILMSPRNVDSLLAQGDSRRLTNGGVEVQMRTIHGINYSVRAWNNKSQTRRLHVSVPVERHGRRYTALPDLSGLAESDLQSLHYRFTVDGGRSFAEVRGRLLDDPRDGLIIDFEDISTFPLVGRLAGHCRPAKANKSFRKDRKARFWPYSFAIPDRHELLTMIEGPF